MTKKRFTLDSEENGLCQCILVDGEEVPTCEIVKLLNELSDKCEFFEIENEALEDGATKYAELHHKSLKENEQLKEQISNLEHTRDYCVECCERLEKEIEQLKQKNEILRQTIERLCEAW